MKVFVIISATIVSIFLSMSAHAEETIFTNSSMLSGSVSNTISASVNKDHKRAYNNLSASANIAWTDQIQSSMTIGINKEFTRERETLFDDLMLGTHYSNIYTHEATDISLGSRAAIFIPTSKASRNASRRLVTLLGLNLSKKINALILGYKIAGTYYSHKFRTAKNGTSNKRYGMANNLTVGYQISSPLAFTTMWTLLNTATYSESPQTTYSFVQELSYDMTKKINLSIGLQTGGQQFKNNAQELNLSLFDSEGTSVFMGATLKL